MKRLPKLQSVAESDPLGCAAMERFSDTRHHGNAPSVEPFARSRHLQTHHSRRKAFRGDLNPSVGFLGAGGGDVVSPLSQGVHH